MRLRHFSFAYDYPATAEPAWAPQVERWYQLDAAAFGLTELYWRERENLSSRPAAMFLASPGGSNFTDRQFAAGATPSPTKFVHTLPNIRSAALLQVMGWSGRVLCLQKDPETVLAALSEAVRGRRNAWVVSAFPVQGRFEAHIFVLGSDGPLKIWNSGVAKTGTHDKDWFSWLSNGCRGHFQALDFEVGEES